MCRLACDTVGVACFVCYWALPSAQVQFLNLCDPICFSGKQTLCNCQAVAPVKYEFLPMVFSRRKSRASSCIVCALRIMMMHCQFRWHTVISARATIYHKRQHAQAQVPLLPLVCTYFVGPVVDQLYIYATLGKANLHRHNQLQKD